MGAGGPLAGDAQRRGAESVQGADRFCAESLRDVARRSRDGVSGVGLGASARCALIMPR